MGFGKMIAGLFKKDDTGQDSLNPDGESSETRGIPAEAPEQRLSALPSDKAVESATLSPAGGGVTENQILEVLTNVYDPEIPIDIVNLGLIYGIDIDGGNVRITMTMTAPGCPASTQIAGESKILVGEIPGVDNVEIDLVWDPPWDPSKMSEEAQDSLGIF